jgi:putative addiction module component (TIGR02574 family)
MDKSRLAELLKLPAEERFALPAALWDSLADAPDQVPVPDWHRAILEERLAAGDRDDAPGQGFAELRASLERRQ